MRGLRSTIALAVVLAGLGAYIYFVTWKQPATEPGPVKDKVFPALQADKIDELRLKVASGDVTTLKKAEGGWQIIEPVSARAEETEVSGVTSNLASLPIERLIDQSPSDLKQFGLDTPRIDVGFKAAGDKEYRHLLIGDKNAAGKDVFVKRGDDKKVFIVSAFLESSFDRPTFQLREKTLVKFDRDKVDALDITSEGKAIRVAKDGGEWKLTKPVQAKADFAAVEGLVGRLQTAQMKSIVTGEPTPADLKKYGLDRPAVTVNIGLGSARATLVVGGSAGENAVYARDASRADVMTIDKALADDLRKGADDYRRKDIFEFKAYNATRLEISRSGQTVVFEKTKGQGENAPDKWRRVSPSAGDVDKDKMGALLSKLADLRASAFADEKTKTGLNAPVATVAVKFEDGKKEERVSFGKPDSNVWVARPSDAGAAKIESADFNEAMKALDELSK